MNYWHLQMHPSDSEKFKKDKLIRILEKKQVIGMGESWTNQHGQEVSDPTIFKNEIHTDDVVLIRDGSSPIALVQVTGPWYIKNTINEDFDWFKLRRPIKLLKGYDDSNEELINSILSEYGKDHIQAPGTLTRANNNNATNKFIKQWHLQVQKDMVMENIKLSPNRIESIKKLWGSYKANYTEKDLELINKQIIGLQEDWQYYKNNQNKGR